MSAVTVLRGRVSAGRGEGAFFTGLPWARTAFVQHLGIDPYPGTLNLRLAGSEDLWNWARLRAEGGVLIPPPDPDQCAARCFPVRLAGRVAGGIVWPQLPGYPPDQLELISPLGLRATLALAEGALVDVEVLRPHALRGLVFDVDGTLVDSLEGLRMAAALALAPLGRAVSREAVRTALNRNSSFWELVLADHPENSPELIAKLRADTMRHWPSVRDQHVTCFPALADTLATLRSRGLKLGIYTGSRGESLPPLKHAGLLDHFDAVITAADVARGKPHPEGLFQCLEKMQLPASETAYVGDSVLDMEAARAAGMLAFGVLSGAASSAELASAGAHRLLNGQAALPLLLAV